MKNIIDNNHNPFKEELSKDTSYFYITFLASLPINYDINAIQDKKAENQEIEITNDAVYLSCPNGYGKTKLNNTYLEKQLGGKATTSNWGTMLKLQEIYQKM